MVYNQKQAKSYCEMGMHFKKITLSLAPLIFVMTAI